MTKKLDFETFTARHAEHQRIIESATEVAIGSTPSREGGGDCFEMLQVRCVECDCVSEAFKSIRLSKSE